MNYKDLDKIWLPDTYFVNAKDSSFHFVTKENKLAQVGPNGLISYRIRLVSFNNLRIYIPLYDAKETNIALLQK